MYMTSNKLLNMSQKPETIKTLHVSVKRQY